MVNLTAKTVQHLPFFRLAGAFMQRVIQMRTIRAEGIHTKKKTIQEKLFCETAWCCHIPAIIILSCQSD